MQKWEYKIETLFSICGAERDLNSLGNAGWELVQTVRENGCLYAILKRPKRD